MPNFFPLTEVLRNELKQPWGKLRRSLSPSDLNEVLSVGERERRSDIVCVGDRTSQVVFSLGIQPRVYIVDGIERRKRIEVLDLPFNSIVLTSNMRGGLSMRGLKALQVAWLARPPVRVDVLGEEDILAVATFALYPLQTVVLYGQPNAGIVVVKITSKIRTRAEAFLSRFISSPVFHKFFNDYRMNK
jgi:uncharacterized protein (UPF0218 family)